MPYFVVSDEGDTERNGGRQASLVWPRLLCTLAHTASEVPKRNLHGAVEVPSREAFMGEV